MKQSDTIQRRVSEGQRGFFSRDGSPGVVLTVYNDGIMGLFRADSGAEYTIRADELLMERPRVEKPKREKAQYSGEARTIFRMESPHRRSEA